MHRQYTNFDTDCVPGVVNTAVTTRTDRQTDTN
jgi:hypothetical protein